jgi:Fe-S-cluster containining protein
VIVWAIRTLIGARRRGLLRLKKADGPVRLECLREKCGLCCDILGGAEVEPQEAPPLRALRVIETVDTGLRLKCHGARCVLLENNLCSAYAARPRACREYPWYNVGGQLYYDAGCPGMKHDRDEHPDVETLRSAETYFNMFSRKIRPLVVGLLSRW